MQVMQVVQVMQVRSHGKQIRHVDRRTAGPQDRKTSMTNP